MSHLNPFPKRRIKNYMSRKERDHLVVNQTQQKFSKSHARVSS